MLDPDALHQTIEWALQRQVPGEFELIVDDPRRSAASGPLTDRPLTDRLETWTALVAVYQTVLHDVVDALEREAGLDSGVYSALAYLDLADPSGRLPMSVLTRLMHPRYSQPGLSRLVQRMEADGLVQPRGRIRPTGARSCW